MSHVLLVRDVLPYFLVTLASVTIAVIAVVDARFMRAQNKIERQYSEAILSRYCSAEAHCGELLEELRARDLAAKTGSV